MFDTSELSAALAGRYRIEREIGRGGMASVYLADDVRHRRKVALKLLEPELARAVGPERFLREIEIAAQLSHPHIVPLYDSGNVDGFLFYVMPYIEGESLRRRMDRERQLPVEEVITITRHIASALEYAHARNVIHRDIKPENILLYEGEAMVADFGIALAVSATTDPRFTRTGMIVGTPTYMSPEQALGEETDGRSDLYSLACLTYEMLVGEPPFAGPTAHAILARRLTEPVPSVRRVRAAVPATVERALTRALSRLPAERFPSLSDFATALSVPTISAEHAPASSPSPSPSVAVLPFRNLSANPDHEYFADGITEDVIAHLAKIRALKVISRSSVMPFKERQVTMREIGAALGAAALLDGSVRHAGERVRIVSTLVDADTEQHLWVETYDRQMTDIFAIQTDVALHIAAALEAELSRDEQKRVQRGPTNDIQAYQLFLQGRQWFIGFTPEALAQSIEYFARAIARDPTFALAHAFRAMAYTELAEQGALAPDVAFAHGAEAAAEALRLDPELSEAHTTMGYLKTAREFDWSGAEQCFKRALELSPSSADALDLYGRLCAALERYDDAIAMLQRAQELDPLAHRVDIVTTLLRAGRYEQAIPRAGDAVELDPENSRARATLGWAYFLTGRHEEGLAELERAVAISPENTMWMAQLGEAYALAGQVDQATGILRKLQERTQHAYVSPYHFAYIHTGLGDHERAMDWLERAVAERTGPAYGIKGSFLFSPLHGHPRFRALLQRMKLA